MATDPTPDLSHELARRIRLVRRDMGQLLFHFTRGAEPVWKDIHGHRMNTAESASTVLGKILNQGVLRGSSKWTYGIDTVCFTEAPIQEFNSVFALASIASERHLRPRYEPYGVAVRKAWLFERGGRPVIYDHPDARQSYPPHLLHRFCPYDPANELDYTWEREWRIATTELELNATQTLVIVPKSDEAFEVVYQYSNPEADFDSDGRPSVLLHSPTWLAVSLDMFGFERM